MIHYAARIRDQNNEPLFFQIFSSENPLQNRRDAVAAIKAWIKLLVKNTGNDPVEILCRKFAVDFHFQVVFHTEEGMIPIECSQIEEADLDQYRHFEYIIYANNGLDMGGEPYETYIEAKGEYLPILVDNKEELFSLRDLLKV